MATAEATKTRRELGEEVRALIAEAKAIEAKGEDATPEEIERATEAYGEARAIGERLTASAKGLSGLNGLGRLEADLRAEVNAPTLPATAGRDAPPGVPATKSFGQAIVESAEFKSWRPGVRGQVVSWEVPGFDLATLKATLLTTGLTGYDRPAGVVTLGTQRLYVADLLAQGTTRQPTVRFVREDSFTPAATTVAEALKPEATFVLSERDAPVAKIAVTGKVSDESIEDFDYIASYINDRLRLMVLIEEEDQELNGSGTPPDLRGILQTVGIQTQAKAADSVADALFKAITKVRAIGHWEPDGIVINPADMQGLRLAKDTNGQYYGGGPFFNPYGVGAFTNVERVWGLPTVVTTAIAAGTALVGAFKFGAMRVLRKGVTVDMAYQNEDDFRKNLVCIRAEMREALCVFRPLAFCSVTGLAA